MLRACTQMGKAQIVQDLRDPALAILNPKAVLDHRLKINPAPTHHTVILDVWTLFHNPRQFVQLSIGKSALGARRPAVKKTLGTISVEPDHPATQRLAIHAANTRRLSPVHPVINRSNREQTAGLVAVPTATRKRTQALRVIVSAQRQSSWHGKSPLPPLNQTEDDLKTQSDSNFRAAGISEIVAAGPDPAVHGVVRWRCCDLRDVIEERFGVAYKERAVGNLLKVLGFSHMSGRPQHPRQEPRVIDAFKKTLPGS